MDKDHSNGSGKVEESHGNDGHNGIDGNDGNRVVPGLLRHAPSQETLVSREKEGVSPSLSIRVDVNADVSAEGIDSFALSPNASVSSSVHSPSLNDDLYKVDSRSFSRNPSSTLDNVKNLNIDHRRNFSIGSSSIFTRNSFEEVGSISLGENNVSTRSLSPLGQNSIFEIVTGADNLRRKQGKLWLSVNNGTTTIHIKGPTIRDIPPVQLSKIDKINNIELKNYIQAINEDYKDFNSNRKLTQETLENLMENENGTSNDDLQNIPEQFFSEDFHLDDPRTFKAVTENSDILLNKNYNGADNNKALTNNTILQEKLSWYLDTVEIHLINEISKSSDSFFSALDDLKEITKRSTNTTEDLAKLDTKFEQLDETHAQVAIDIMKKIKKRQNIEKLENGLLQIKLIMELSDTAETAYYNSQYTKSLDLIDLIESLIRGSNSNENIKAILGQNDRFELYNLQNLAALDNLRKLLHNLKVDIGKSYTKLFVGILFDDLRNHYESIKKQDSLDRISYTISRESRKTINKTPSMAQQIDNSYQKIDDNFKQDIKEYLDGLIRCHKLIESFTIYRDNLVPEVKSIIRENLPNELMINENDSTTSSSRPPQSSSARSGQKSSSLGSNLRAMTPKEFEDMLVNIYTKLSECLRRLTTHQKFLLNLSLDCLSNTEFSQDDQSDLIMKLDITQSINLCIETIQIRMSKILMTRRDQTINLNLEFFLKFYSINGLFLYECESISGFTITTVLQDTVTDQTKLFMNQYGKNSLQFLNSFLEKETWKSINLSSSLQTSVNEILESADEDPSSWLDIMKWTSKNENENENEKTEASDTSSENERKTLIVDDKSFILPSSVSNTVQLVTHYLILKTIFPQYLHQIETTLIEILKVYNDKVNQQVSGANATHTTNLKYITSKHLAIASNLLGFMISLIPYIKRSFDRMKKVEDINDDFDNLANDFKEHQSQIYTKLISIMNDRLAQHCAEIRTINWSEPITPNQCHHYMEVLVKETTTIAKVLLKCLPEVQCSLMLSQIFDNYKTQLINEYSKLEIKDSIQKAIILKDIDYFRVNLSDLIGYGQSGQMIWESVNNLKETDQQIQ
ncbi:hypothetical protein PACTADRAFT_35326 [Pachysolen tannophilus NRRL Y-2460]|uniref:Vacuolar protein sorting-associated protein 54 C-terminal domain-containing protein n=1 Tax=Pachysolen tannophilus NRRL Y-2460 TaxID=669874 RepID=A0A1E4TP73_PACTA|nr:hypothetical protein PACTADRAFT_35326 [Pachysolen tannophilus NRRL Y-2460]